MLLSVTPISGCSQAQGCYIIYIVQAELMKSL